MKNTLRAVGLCLLIAAFAAVVGGLIFGTDVRWLIGAQALFMLGVVSLFGAEAIE